MVYSAGAAYLTVIPSFLNIQRAFEKEAEKLGRTFDKAFGKGFGSSIPGNLANGRDDVRREGERAGGDYAGAFAIQVRRRLTEALKALPKAEIDGDSTPAKRAIEEIRADLERLRDAKVGVNITAEELFAEIALVKAKIAELNDDSATIDVKFNAAAATSALTAIEAMVDQVDGRKITLDFDGGAFAAEMRRKLAAAVQTLPQIDIDANPSPAERAIAEIRADMETLRDVKIGVDIKEAEFFAEITRIRNQLRRLDNDKATVEVRVNVLAALAELEAVRRVAADLDGKRVKLDVDSSDISEMGDNAALSLSRLGALLAAGVSLGTAIVPAAAAAAASISAIATAASAAGIGVGVLALGLFGPIKAVQALSAAHKQSAQSAVSDAGAQDRVASALDGVRNSQEQLARAERDRRQAVADLSKAQEDARRQLEDYTISVRENALQQRQARLDETAAKEALDKILANPRASEAEREQARITFEEKSLQIQDLTIKGKRLAADQADAVKKGVAGSDQVRAAQQKIVDATLAVADAHRQVAASQRQLAAAYQKTGVAGGAALNNLKQAMDALSPAGQRFARFIFGLRSDFKLLQSSAESGLLPGLQRSIEILLPFLQPLATLVNRIGVALGQGFVGFATSLKDPIFQRFFNYIASTAVPALQGMFQFAEDVARGIAGILLGLSGFNGAIGDGLLKWAAGFAKWGETLDTNQGWQRFLAYVRDSAPKVIEFFRNIWDLTAKIVTAAAPIGTFVVKAFGDLFGWLSKLDTSTWTIIIGGIAAVGAALLVVAGITTAMETGVAGALSATVALVGGGLVILYQKVASFRAAVDGVGHVLSALAPIAENIFRGLDRLIEAIPLGVLVTLGVIILGIVVAIKAWALVQSALNLLGQGWTLIVKAYAGATTFFGNVVAGASQRTLSFGGALRNAKAAASEAEGSLSGLTSALGGPWGVALIAATALVGLFFAGMQKQSKAAEEQKQKVDALSGSLRGLADNYRGADQASQDYLNNLVRNDTNFRDLVLKSRDLGLSVDVISRALHGNGAALAQVNSTYQTQIDMLDKVSSVMRKAGTDVGVTKGEWSDYNSIIAKHPEFARLTADQADKLSSSLQVQKDAVNDASAAEAKQNAALQIVNNSAQDFATSLDNIRDVLSSTSPSAEEFKSAIDSIGGVTASTASKAGALALVSDKIAASQLLAADKATAFQSVLDGLGASTQSSGPTFKALASTFGNIATSELSARDKADLLRQALDLLYGSAQAQVRASETLISTQSSLETQLHKNDLGFDLTTGKTLANKQAIVENRQALETALQAIRDKYVADIASGVAEGKARDAHDKSTAALLKQLPVTQRNSGAVKELVKDYGDIPAAKKTVVTTPGLDAAIDNLIMAHAVQIGLSQSPVWTRAQILAENEHLQAALAGELGSNRVFKAEGGRIPGWSPHSKADNIPVMATAGEWMQPVDSVNYYGTAFMEAVRTKQIPREIFGGRVLHRASGGLIGWPIKINGGQINKVVDLEDLWRQWDDRQFPPWPASPAASRGDSGVWRKIVKLIESTGPISGTFGNAYRAGDPLWHGSGRAVDWMGFNQDALATWASGLKPLELIHRTTSRDYAYTRGVNKGSFNEALMEEHRNHMHLAMDSGGMLPPGISTIFNGTGAPEPVLTGQQWSDIRTQVHNGDRGGHGSTYNFEFRDTTLDPGKLRAIQDREAVYNRDGRAR